MLLILSAALVVSIVLAALGYTVGGTPGFERRWRDSLFRAMLPAVDGRPGVGDLDLSEFWAIYERHAPPLVRVGLRAAVWILTLLPVFVPGFFRPFHRLDSGRQDRFLCAASVSRFYLLRQLVMTIKTFAAFAYFRDQGVRRLFDAR